MFPTPRSGAREIAPADSRRGASLGVVVGLILMWAGLSMVFVLAVSGVPPAYTAGRMTIVMGVGVVVTVLCTLVVTRHARWRTIPLLLLTGGVYLFVTIGLLTVST